MPLCHPERVCPSVIPSECEGSCPGPSSLAVVRTTELPLVVRLCHPDDQREEGSRSNSIAQPRSLYQKHLRKVYPPDGNGGNHLWLVCRDGPFSGNSSHAAGFHDIWMRIDRPQLLFQFLSHIGWFE